MPPLAMIRSRAAASRAPAAPLRGRSAPPDPAARSQEPAAIRAREHSEVRPQTVNGPSRNHLRSRGDAGKRTASGPKERSVEPLALPIRARFVPLPGHRTPRLTGVYRTSRPASSSPSCSRRAAGWPLFVSATEAACRTGRAIPSGPPRRGNRVPVAAPETVSAEPAVYLSWTGDVPVVYPPYTCR